MPSRTSTNGATAQPVGRRFELPALDFKFAPLTEGTSIPPPLPSPIEEEPPRAQTPVEKVDEKPATASVNGNGKPTTTTTTTTHSTKSSPQSIAKAGKKRPAEDSPISPVSPTMSNRPGSIRRLFSRNLLNASYANGEDGASSIDGSHQRPASRSTTDEKRSKRSSGWFRRLRGVDHPADRSSGVFEDITKQPQQPMGPPPPMIPELGELEAKVDLKDGSSFGTDLFKNIQ